MARPIAHSMALTIDLNSQIRAYAVEIENVRRKGMLAPKGWQAWRTMTKPHPK